MNCGFVHSVPGLQNFRSFMAMFPLSQKPTSFMQHYGLITTQETAGGTDGIGRNPELGNRISSDLPKDISPFDLPYLDNEEFKKMWEQEQGDKMSKNSDELLHVHYKLGHLSVCQDKVYGCGGWLDKRLSSCIIPKCAGCMYSKATCHPWRTMGVVNQILQSKAPGEVVFIDQLVLSMPGLIGQINRFLAHTRYHYATMFLDHFSDCPYIVMQNMLMGEETIRAKANYEGPVCRHGVIMKHYQTDNWIFAGTAFQENVRAQRQTMSYCGVGEHHQNGRIEKLIRDLKDHGKTVLLHAQQRWPDAVNENLWP